MTNEEKSREEPGGGRLQSFLFHVRDELAVRKSRGVEGKGGTGVR